MGACLVTGAVGVFPVQWLWFSGLTPGLWREGQAGSWMLTVPGEPGSQGTRQGSRDLAFKIQALADVNPGGFLEGVG